jgi:argininosuccinate lyase
MNTLWCSEKLSKKIFDYTTESDRDWDQRLLKWDVIGTIAHVNGLALVGLINRDEANSLIKLLKQIYQDILFGSFTTLSNIPNEDIHTSLESYLTQCLQEVGEKVHIGRSRNDQIILDLRLYAKDFLLIIIDNILNIITMLVTFAKKHKATLFPGYTHQQRAMPSSVGLWATGFAEALLDDLVSLFSNFELIDRCPLGSGAGFGVPLPINRKYVSELLGFEKVQNNVTTVQASRGKFEAAILSALWMVGYDLSKFSWDVILFSSEEFNFFKLPESITTGSSIMPNKRNPDVFELIRAYNGVLEGLLVQAMSISGHLPSGYHRDLQLTKGPMIQGFEIVNGTLEILSYIIPDLKVNFNVCRDTINGGILATEEVFKQVRQGVPFRTAYRKMVKDIQLGNIPKLMTTQEIIDLRTHIGGINCLMISEIEDEVIRKRHKANALKNHFYTAINNLIR